MVRKPATTGNNKFLSTLSLRRATLPTPEPPRVVRFLSTLSLRRATNVRPETRLSYAISIHALLAESDGKIPVNIMLHFDFYPRSPCGERLLPPTRRLGNVLFLSTLSLRRATMIHPRLCNAKLNFYPRSPCGERPTPCGACAAAPPISIHALLAESD